ncbi:MAG: hypothetical protein Fur0022_23940 [Anaerolineales bacterium]
MLKKNTLILVAVFAVLVTVLWLLQRNKELNPTTPDTDTPTLPPPTYLFDFSSEMVVGVLVENVDGQVVELQKDADGVWLLIEPPTLPEGTNQTPITSAMAQIGSVRILNELTILPELDAIGLDQPDTTITFTLDSGETVKVEVGNASPNGSGYYVRVNGAPPKLVDKFIFNQLTGFLTTPPILPTPVLTTTIGITPTLDLTTPVP